MHAGNIVADDALARMREWQWMRPTPDGVAYSTAVDLNVMVNRLAMSGLQRPQNAVLTLLCRGDIAATGDYHWHKYEFGSQFSLSGEQTNIEQRQWQRLQDAIDYELMQLGTNEWPGPTVDLTRLGLTEQPTFEWEFSQNRFSFALCPPDVPEHGKGYFEEIYSAYEIRLIPQFLLEADAWETKSATSKGGRRPANWWPAFAEELAMYVHESGIPDGRGSEGQTDVIDAVFLRLQNSQKPEPSRTSVQPVVSAVLNRIRSA